MNCQASYRKWEVIKNVILESSSAIPIVMGDFNLDEQMKYMIDYSHNAYYESLDQTFKELGLHLVNFDINCVN